MQPSKKNSTALKQKRATPLRIPRLKSDCSPQGAALVWAKAGWYVLPMERGTKHPGSVVGDGWEELSTRDPAQIKKWWPTGTDRGIALHVGRSGGFVFDLDRPENVTAWMWEQFEGAPYLWTSEKKQRRHVLFLMPEGRMLGSGLGAFRGQRWGEVRGKNGVIAVYPTVHPDQINHAEAKDREDLGCYALGQTGPLPPMPEVFSKMLNDASDATEALATDADLEAFLDEYTDNREPWGLKGVKTEFEIRDKLQRHPSMVDALCMAFREAIIGRFPARQAYDELNDLWCSAFAQEEGRRPARDEFLNLAKWCAAQALAADSAETWAKVNRGDVDEDAFWDARPFLSDVRQMAQARRVAPWAVLGAAMARGVAAVPPWAVLPPLVGSHASLNLFVALVGASGSGKGAAEQTANDLFDTDPVVDSATVGSGEGIAKLFAHKVKGEQVNERNAVLFTVPEVDNLTALGSRQGATLLPQLRMGWSGERLGFSYADPTKAVRIERHRYRLNLVLGVQPERAGPLLDDADGGTPQRFLWFPTTDPGAPDIPPEPPARWSLPPWPQKAQAVLVKFVQPEVQLLPCRVTSADLVEIDVPDEAVQFIREAQLVKLRGSGETDITGHAALSRLKAAAALMVLDSRHDKISDEDWRLAGVVMEVSARTRGAIESALAARAGKENVRRGQAEGTRAVAAAEVTEESAIKRICSNIKKHLAALDPERSGLTIDKFRRKIAARDRDLVDDALYRLIDVGDVEEIPGEKGPLYRLAQAAG